MLYGPIRVSAGANFTTSRTKPGVNLRVAPVILVTLILCSCTVIRARPSATSAPGIEASGLIGGYATLGFSGEERLLSLKALGGSNPGAVAELALWKLLYFEVGLAGISIGVGPVQIGLGTFFYSPKAPVPVGKNPESRARPTVDQEDSDQQELESVQMENSDGVL